MLKYSKIINEETKECDVGIGTNTDFYKFIGMTKMDVEQAYDGNWYVLGYAPEEPAPIYEEQRVSEYPSIQEQLDMIYWDKVNGTNNWQKTIQSIKEKYPKE